MSVKTNVNDFKDLIFPYTDASKYYAPNSYAFITGDGYNTVYKCIASTKTSYSEAFLASANSSYKWVKASTFDVIGQTIVFDSSYGTQTVTGVGTYSGWNTTPVYSTGGAENIITHNGTTFTITEGIWRCELDGHYGYLTTTKYILAGFTGTNVYGLWRSGASGPSNGWNSCTKCLGIADASSSQASGYLSIYQYSGTIYVYGEGATTSHYATYVSFTRIG